MDYSIELGVMKKRISIIYGNDIAMMTRTLLDVERTAERIKSKDAAIVIKPNLVVSSDPENGETTHTSIVKTTVEYLLDNGFRNITIAEGSWIGASTEECFRKLGYYDIKKEYGVRLVDTKKDKYRKVAPAGIEMEISTTFLDSDFFINIPVLKGHCQTLMTHAMKNLKGCLSDKSKRDFHRMGLNLPIAALNTVLKPDLTISDGICGDLDFEEGGNPVETDRMMSSDNPVLLDAYAATLMGYSPDEIGYIREARKLGLIESYDWTLNELSKPVAGKAKPKGSVKQLSSYTLPDEACSACYASLIRALKIFEEEGGKIQEKIAIGQGYRGKSPELGVGACCSKARINVKGCPASADDILSMLRSL